MGGMWNREACGLLLFSRGTGAGKQHHRGLKCLRENPRFKLILGGVC
jgi:hypothetical protein